MPSTYIGIAFYSANGFLTQVAIVLSKNKHFKTVESYGTVIQSVNGIVVKWTDSGRSPAVFEPYMTLEGVIDVMKVNKAPSQIWGFISNLGWRAENVRISTSYPRPLVEPYSSDYVCRALLYLCENNVISLPTEVQNHIEGLLDVGLQLIQSEREGLPDVFKPSTPDVFPIFPLDPKDQQVW